MSARMPFDADPIPGGVGRELFAIIDGEALAMKRAVNRMSLTAGVSTDRARELLDEQGSWHRSHFASCAQAAEHRRAR